MTRDIETNRSEKILLAILIPLLIFSYFLNLGLQPIYFEEPKRALIAMEMMFNGNFVVPTETGVPYYNKPPLYNWLLCAVFYITGNFSEFSVRILSVISFLALALVHFVFSRKYMGTRFALYSTLLLLVSVDIYFYFSLTGEIDLFFSLLVYSNIIIIFYFYDKNQLLLMFVLAYLIATLGLFTKSFPAVVFMGISLVVVLWLKNNLKLLFSWKHLVGILILVLFTGGYLWLYHKQHDTNALIRGLLFDSGKRTFVASSGLNFIQHLLMFPVELIIKLLPASILLVFVFRSSLLRVFRKNVFIHFSIMVIIANVIIYWISPDAKHRYIYSLFPFLINVLLFFYLDSKQYWKNRYINILAWISVVSAFILFIGIDFIPRVNNLPYTLPVSIALVCSTGGLFYLHYRKRVHPLLIIISVFVLSRILFDVTVLPARTQDDHSSIRKAEGLKIAEITGQDTLYIYKDTEISNGFTYYIVSRTRIPVNRTASDSLQAFYLIDEQYFSKENYITHHEFDFHEARFRLVKFERSAGP